ncbi:hypothetical protein [Telmatospirillum sp.]|uniref:hypothetical protein n=1 Tax=Telmatospirillum sp. TaxID=2079197 RepID=UPI00283D22C4|nr:hypothetical protein [Telmatospirillum sp.]MDR3436425.1 hypothetical protein [Telmatospirillum sp.]
MTDVTEWIIAGTATLGVIGASIAWVVARHDRANDTLWSELNKHAAMDGAVHTDVYERIDKFRDDYLRSADFDRHTESINEQMRQMQTAIQALTIRVDGVLVILGKAFPG